MSDNRKSIHAAAGEHLVLGELLKREKMAFLAQGPAQKGWDIIIVADSEQCSQNRRIQVKTKDWPLSRPVQIDPSSDFDFLVIVLLDKEHPRSRFLIFDREGIEPHLSEENPCRTDGNRTMTISDQKMNELCQHGCEDRWDLLCSIDRDG